MHQPSRRTKRFRRKVPS